MITFIIFLENASSNQKNKIVLLTTYFFTNYVTFFLNFFFFFLMLCVFGSVTVNINNEKCSQMQKYNTDNIDDVLTLRSSDRSCDARRRKHLKAERGGRY